MDNNALKNAIIKELGSHKSQFLDQVQRKIYNNIASLSSADCLTIVEKKSYYDKTWEPSDSLDGYIPRFIAFLRKKNYDGNELDSILTDKVVGIVVSTYNSFVQEHKDIFIKPILEETFKNNLIANTIAKQAVERWKSTVPQAIKQKLVTALVHKIEDSISTNIVHASSDAVATAASKIIATTATIPITKSIAIMLSKHMALFLKVVVSKVLASAAFKTMMATMVKKFVAVKVLSIIITSIGAKLAGISIGWILAPLILAFIAYEVSTLPRKMAKSISEAVVMELDREYNGLNTTISTSIVAELSGSAMSTFIGDVIQDASMKELIDSLDDI